MVAGTIFSESEDVDCLQIRGFLRRKFPASFVAMILLLSAGCDRIRFPDNSFVVLVKDGTCGRPDSPTTLILKKSEVRRALRRKLDQSQRNEHEFWERVGRDSDFLVIPNSLDAFTNEELLCFDDAGDQIALYEWIKRNGLEISNKVNVRQDVVRRLNRFAQRHGAQIKDETARIQCNDENLAAFYACQYGLPELWRFRSDLLQGVDPDASNYSRERASQVEFGPTR